MIAIAETPPTDPGLEIVNVPARRCSGVSLRERPRAARSAIFSPIAGVVSFSARRMTGTISPCSVSTAMPRLISPQRMSCVPSNVAFRSGYSASAAHVARAMNDSAVSRRCPAAKRAALSSARARSTAVMSASASVVMWAAVWRERIMCSAITLR